MTQTGVMYTNYDHKWLEVIMKKIVDPHLEPTFVKQAVVAVTLIELVVLSARPGPLSAGFPQRRVLG